MGLLLRRVRAALLELAEQAVGPAGFTVFDGPVPRVGLPRKYVLVGSDGGDTGIGDGDELQESAIAEQQRSSIGNGYREESGAVVVSAWSWDGSTNLAPHRTRVSAATDQIIAALAADPSLGGLLEPAWPAEPAELRLREAQTPDGSLAGEVLTISYRALIS